VNGHKNENLPNGRFFVNAVNKYITKDKVHQGPLNVLGRFVTSCATLMPD